jgi:hypothetical protein
MIKVKPNVTHYLTSSLSSYWVFDSEETNTFISGIYGIQGVVYIDDGTGFTAYQVYIDNGTGWDLHIPYIDNGTSWDQCGSTRLKKETNKWLNLLLE